MKQLLFKYLLKNSQTITFVETFYIFFINGLLALMLGAILPYMTETYDLNYKISGMLIAIHSVGNLTSSFLSGILPRYIGRKNTILLLSICGCLGFITMTLWHNPIVLLIAFFFTGINRGAVSNFSNATINEVATGKAWALNLLHSIFAIGAFTSPFIALLSVRNNPNHWVFACYLMGFLCLTEFILYGFMDIKEPSKTISKREKPDWSFLKNKFYLTALGILFTYLCAEQAVNGWLVTYFKNSNLLEDSLAQSMASLLWVVILIGRLLNAYISKKFKKSRLLLINVLGYFIFFIVLLAARSLSSILIGIVGVGFFMAGIYPTTISLVGYILKQSPMALSFLLTIAGLGAILMPSLIGFISERAGIMAGMSTVIIAVILTVLLISYNFYIYRKVEE